MKIKDNIKTKIVILSLTIIIFAGLILLSATQSKPDTQNEHRNEVILQLPDNFIADLNAEETKHQDFVYESHGNGSCSLINVTNKDIVELQIPTQNSKGETVTKISSSALKQCCMLTSITIPESIKEIDSDAFIDCENLVVIMTSTANTKFCTVGGVLLSKDRSELLFYPPNKTGNHYLLSSDIRKIGEFAFYKINNLKKILYEGSAKNFAEIKISVGNQNFQKLPVTCNYISEKS